MFGFKNCFYNKEDYKIYIKEFGQDKHKSIPYSHYYYIRNPKLKEWKYTDLDGVPLEKKMGRPDPDILKNPNYQTFENNIKPEQKFLSDKYEGKTLTPEMSEFNICYLDIELGDHDTDPNFNGFPTASLAELEVNLVSFYSSRDKKMFMFALDAQNTLNSDPEFHKEVKEVVNRGGRECTYEYIACSDEKELFKKLLKEWANQSFDIITGWNVLRFDMVYLIQRCKKLFRGVSRSQNPFAKNEENLYLEFSPLGILNEKQVSSLYDKDKKEPVYKIGGIDILDWMVLYKKFDLKPKPSMSLQYAATKELGRGKLELDGQINQTYKTNWKQFVVYNVEDCMLVYDLEQKLKFINLNILLGFEARNTFENAIMASVLITGDLMEFMHSHRKMALPDKHPAIRSRDWWWEEKRWIVKDEFGNIEYQNCLEGETEFPEKKLKGAICIANPGIYRDCISNDVNSSYPHQIMSFNLSPEVKRTVHQLEFEINKPYEGVTIQKIQSSWQKVKYSKSPEEFVEDINNKFPNLLFPISKNYIKTPLNGVYTLRHKKGIITELVKIRFDDRKRYKANIKTAKDASEANMWDIWQQARKTQINSMYGVYALGMFVFHDIDMARAITRGGRNIVRKMGQGIEKFLKEIYIPKMIKAKKLDEKKVWEEINKKKIWFLTDTDSVKICLEGIHKSFYPEMPQYEFLEMMDQKIIQPAYDKLLKLKAEKENVEQLFKFACEGYYSALIVTGKKQYITEIINDEGVKCDPPKIKYTGIALKRSDTSDIVKEVGEIAVKKILAGESKTNVINYLISVFDMMKKAPFDKIARRIGLNKELLESSDTEELPEETGGILGQKCVKNMNWLIQKHKLPITPIGSGSKIKYFKLLSNKYNFEEIGWVGNCPEKFFREQGLLPDYNKLFEISVGNLMARILTACGMLNKGERINLVRSKFNV